MIDPVAALGLAGNIVTFVDFSHKLLHSTLTLYASATGASASHNSLGQISSDLILLSKELTAPSASTAIPEPLKVLAGQCKDVAGELLEVLEKLRVKETAKGRERRWESLKQALGGVWRRDEIEALVRRMEGLRGEMGVRIGGMLIGETSEISKALANLTAENKQLAMDGSHQLDERISGVNNAISQIKPELMASLSRMLSGLAKEVNAMASDQMLLNSLWFRSMREREARIHESHRKTFKWILDSSPPTEFEEWLRSSNGFYWISGKAGSGKSTLMKFLVSHPRTTALLKEWAGAKQLVTAKFFFWNAGSAMQNSYNGLIRSLLFEVLKECPELIGKVCASKAETFQPFATDLEDWSDYELSQAIEQLRQESGVSARYCFFIDGLDEYNGDHDHIVDILQSLRSWPDIKLCVSSRPWNIFIDTFGSDPQLALQDLTRRDIELYIRDTLEENPRFRSLKARDSRSQQLVQEILDKAKGVFLWVFLVVKELLTGVQNADRISDLGKRLRHFPETLEAYFGHMIDSVEPIYREQMAQTFKYVLAARIPLSLTTYSILDEDDVGHLLASSESILKMDNVICRHNDMRRRLNARCKGLLETGSTDVFSNGLLTEPTVGFLHRTARDFLLTKDMQEMLAKNVKPGFEPLSQICQALIAQLKLIGYKELEDCLDPATFKTTFKTIVLYSLEFELVYNAPLTSLMDETCAVVDTHGFGFGLTEDNGCIENLQYNGVRLHLYLKEVLMRGQVLPAPLVRDILKSVLLIQPSLRRRRVWQQRPQIHNLDIDLIRLALKHGASPNDKADAENTVWINFLSIVQQNYFRVLDYRSSLAVVFELLIQDGADLEARVGVSINSHDTVSIQDILEKTFGETQAQELLRRAPSRDPALPQQSAPPQQRAHPRWKVMMSVLKKLGK